MSTWDTKNTSEQSLSISKHPCGLKRNWWQKNDRAHWRPHVCRESDDTTSSLQTHVPDGPSQNLRWLRICCALLFHIRHVLQFTCFTLHLLSTSVSPLPSPQLIIPNTLSATLSFCVSKSTFFFFPPSPWAVRLSSSTSNAFCSVRSRRGGG